MKRLEATHGADIVPMFRPVNTVGPICGWADLPRYDRGYRRRFARSPARL